MINKLEIVFVLYLIKQIVGHQIEQAFQQKYQVRSSNQITSNQCKMGQINQFSIQANKLSLFHVKYSENQRFNMNLFSNDLPFGYLFQVENTFIQFNQLSIQKQLLNFRLKLIDDKHLQNKIKQNLQYKHFINFQSQYTNVYTQKLFLLALYIPLSQNKNLNEEKNLSYQITIIFTKSFFYINDEIDGPIQYALNQNQTYNFVLNVSNLKQKNQNQKNQFQILQVNSKLMFHTLHFVGDYFINISLIVNNRSIQIAKQFDQSTFQISFNELDIIKQNFIKSLNEQTPIQLSKSIEVILEVQCRSKSCNFLTQIQIDKSLRKMIPGVPYKYSIQKYEIFAISNLLDLQISLDISKKSGFPQYKLCSSKSSSPNQCLKQLRNSQTNSHLLQVKQSDDKIHAFGRFNQVQINSEHQVYCYQCYYYILLNTDYDKVQGTITFKNKITHLLIPEGNSITKILRKQQNDTFIIYGLQTKLLLQKISGEIQVYYGQINIQQYHNTKKYQVSLLKQVKFNLNPQQQEQKYYTIDLTDSILNTKAIDTNNKATDTDSSNVIDSNNKIIDNKNKVIDNNKKKIVSSNNIIRKLLIKTFRNYPSTFYSLIIVNQISQKISLRDGIPFFNKQKNYKSTFKYITQNYQTNNFGTIIINSNQIQNIQIEIYGNCKINQTHKVNQFVRKYVTKDSQSYKIQPIEHRKINLMANRVDVMIQPHLCKNYVINIVNHNQLINQTRTPINYQILVSFIDSMILPLNNQVPGILKYPHKMIQAYQVFVPQKMDLSIWVNFCRGDTSRMEIYSSKQNLFAQNSQKLIKFQSTSQLQEILYSAHSGIFYITIQFFGFSNILEFTILVKARQNDQGFYYTDLSREEKYISYQVKQGSFFSTTYELYFSPIFLKHWSKDVQRDIQYFQTNYYILQSNSYPLLKRASSCSGQFFSQIVNHHQHFKQVKLQKQLLHFHPYQSDLSSEYSHIEYYQRGYYTYEYQTENPLSFLTIVPVVAKYTNRNGEKQIVVLPYWKFDQKSRQPYQITQLFNGKLYSILKHWGLTILIRMEDYLDFHPYEEIIATFFIFLSCLPITCCLLVCIFKIKKSCENTYLSVYNYIQKMTTKMTVISNSQNQSGRISTIQQSIDDLNYLNDETNNLDDKKILQEVQFEQNQIQIQDQIQLSSDDGQILNSQYSQKNLNNLQQNLNNLKQNINNLQKQNTNNSQKQNLNNLQKSLEQSMDQQKLLNDQSQQN